MQEENTVQDEDSSNNSPQPIEAIDSSNVPPQPIEAIDSSNVPPQPVEASEPSNPPQPVETISIHSEDLRSPVTKKQCVFGVTNEVVVEVTDVNAENKPDESNEKPAIKNKSIEVTSLHDLHESFKELTFEQYCKAMKKVKQVEGRLQSDMEVREEVLKTTRRRYGETLSALSRAKKACEDGKGSRELIAAVEMCTREAEKTKQAKLEKEALYRKLDEDDKKKAASSCARIWNEFGVSMKSHQEKYDAECEEAWKQM